MVIYDNRLPYCRERVRAAMTSPYRAYSVRHLMRDTGLPFDDVSAAVDSLIRSGHVYRFHYGRPGSPTTYKRRDSRTQPTEAPTHG